MKKKKKNVLSRISYSNINVKQVLNSEQKKNTCHLRELRIIVLFGKCAIDIDRWSFKKMQSFERVHGIGIYIYIFIYLIEVKK